MAAASGSQPEELQKIDHQLPPVPKKPLTNPDHSNKDQRGKKRNFHSYDAISADF